MEKGTGLVQPSASSLLLAVARVSGRTAFVTVSFSHCVGSAVGVTRLTGGRNTFMVNVASSTVTPVGRRTSLLFRVRSSRGSAVSTTPTLFSFLGTIVTNISVRSNSQFRGEGRRCRGLSDRRFFVRPKKGVS